MLKVKQGDTTTACQNYIETNDQIRQRNILIKKDIAKDEVTWIFKLVHFPETSILPRGRNHELLQCPVTFNENAIPGYIYLLPVYYRKTGKTAQLFAFKGVEGKTDEVIPFILSPVNEKYFKEITSVPQTDKGKVGEKPTATTSDPIIIGTSSSDPSQKLIDFSKPITDLIDLSGNLPEYWRMKPEDAGGKGQEDELRK